MVELADIVGGDAALLEDRVEALEGVIGFIYDSLSGIDDLHLDPGFSDASEWDAESPWEVSGGSASAVDPAGDEELKPTGAGDLHPPGLYYFEIEVAQDGTGNGLEIYEGGGATALILGGNGTFKGAIRVTGGASASVAIRARAGTGTLEVSSFTLKYLGA